MFRRALSAFLAVLLVTTPALAAPEVSPSERVTRNVVVRAQPGGDAAMVGGLFPGDEAELLGEVPGWYQIRLDDGRTGYVSKSWTVVTDDAEPAATAAGPLKVHVIDVGTGLAIFLEGPGFTMLYDAGSQDDLAMGGDNRVLAYIKATRPDVTTIDHLVLSHPHKDHLELLPNVFEELSVRHVWDSGALNDTRGYCRFLRAVAAEPGVQYHNAIATGGHHRVTFAKTSCRGEVAVPRSAQMTDQPVTLGPSTSMTILHRDASRRSDPNDNTVVVRIDHGSNRVLLAGDAEGGARLPPSAPPAPNSVEGKLVACCLAALRANALVVGHHGSLTSSRHAFLNAVDADIFVISSGPHPYKRVVLPDAAIVAELRSRGHLLQTDIDDDQCELDETKIGPDADESPGGCDSVIIIVPRSGTVTAAYNRNAD